MSSALIQNFFSTQIPPLKFRLAANSPLKVDATTVSYAKKLATLLTDHAHSDVLKFLDHIAHTPNKNLSSAEQAILSSDGFLRFLFYLTVYCNRLGMMLEAHAFSYLPKIGISLAGVKRLEFYPKFGSLSLETESFDGEFADDIDGLMLFCNLISEHFLRFFFAEEFIEVSAIDILEYAGTNS